MRGRKSTDYDDNLDPIAAYLREGTRHTPNFVVHFRRNEFYDPAFPPFWELTVANSRHSYRVMVGVPADQLDLAIKKLPEPSAERHGVDFMRAYKEVFLPDDIRRLTGETMMAFLIYKVKSAPPGSSYEEGRYYNDADLARPITQTEADIAANDRRKEVLLRKLEAEREFQRVRDHGYRMSP
ncbi:MULTISPECIES: hypothetical protein [unclassified Mesorhizobium]|uniref:hypothetical protein n=1 Tax=unclassified Mesorhizobium TaxID=325217 RepID=UPI00112E9F8A|nr:MULTISPECIES: hypothetical protein [unclassified Mesorhizobium]TPK96974.1 hypothetical protein FJ567_20005 [Mesorhizobium sp. B2-4-16]TPL57365.1 hypothetical protein FJ956_30215 [Mesorhizobium sp. B2-4-3]